MARLPSTVDLMSMIKEHARRLRKLETAAGLGNSSVGAGGLRVYGGGGITIEAPGTIDVGGPATFGGATTIGGDLAVTGTLSLPAGIIGNDALAEPVAFGGAGASGGNFAVTTTSTVATSSTIAVPVWADQAIVLAVANGGAWNDRAVADYLFVLAEIDGTSGGGTPGLTGPASFANASASAQRIVNNPGATITVACRVHAVDGTWSANTANVAHVDAIAIFRRNPA